MAGTFNFTFSISFAGKSCSPFLMEAMVSWMEHGTEDIVVEEDDKDDDDKVKVFNAIFTKIIKIVNVNDNHNQWLTEKLVR